MQQPLAAELLFEQPWSPDPTAIAARLAERFGEVSIRGDEGAELYVLDNLPAGTIEHERVPASLSFVLDDAFDPDDRLRAALDQTWDWPDAGEATRNAVASLLVTPMLSQTWLDRSTRLELLHAGLEAVLAQVEPLALHWPFSQRLVRPSTYRAAREAAADPLFPAVNVRMFRITGNADEILMDTLGLARFDLPDVEIRYAAFEPGAVAQKLSDLALYLFERGDVIDDGDTVEGIPTGASWRVRRRTASLAPDRLVLELVPVV